MYHMPRCDIIFWMIYRTSALNCTHLAYFTRNIVRPRCLDVFFFLPPFSTLIGFQESGPLSIVRLQGKHVDLVALSEGVYLLKHFNQRVWKCLKFTQPILRAFSIEFKWTYTHTNIRTHPHMLCSCAHNHFESNGGWAKHFYWWMSFSIVLISSAGQQEISLAVKVASASFNLNWRS